MSLSPSEVELMDWLDRLENQLLLQEILDTGKVLELIHDLQEELADCWNIIAYHEGR